MQNNKLTQQGNALIVILVVFVLVVLGTFGTLWYLKAQKSPEISPTPSTGSNANLITYTSSNLGVSFTYLQKQGVSEYVVKENGNKICITYDSKDEDCQKGQLLEVFQKDKTETLEVAIKRLFLAEKDPDKCFVTTYSTGEYPSNVVQALISYPDDKEFDLGKMFEKQRYCSNRYARTNGLRFFLEDKNHPTKFLFFGIGQYGINSEGNKSWHQTIIVE